MPIEYYDGHPMQAGVHAGKLSGRFPEFSGVGLIECVVIARRYVDAQDGNRMRTSVEYDVRSLETGQTIPNVRTLSRLSGLDNGDEAVYHPASRALSDNASFSFRTSALDSDGDVVVVGFLSGSRETAVIVGALPHGEVRYGAKAADGERRFLQHNGTTAQIKADGSFEVARGDTSVSVAKDGVVTIKAATVRAGSDMGNLTNASGVGDSVHTTLSELVTKLSPFFVGTGGPPPLPGTFANGTIASGSSSVLVTKG